MSQVYVIQAITPLHVGEGSAVGAVDLPVTRERHTGWPWIPGSGLKGALRARALRLDVDPALTTIGFGPAPDSELAVGALRFAPAILLALPVRSLSGTFTLLTCPLALARLARALGQGPTLPCPTVDQVAPNDPDLLRIPWAGVNNDYQVVLEDLPFTPIDADSVSAWAGLLAQAAGLDAPLEHLAVVHDQVFAHAVRFWTSVRTRNSIGEDGVVQDHKLFTVEDLPPETLLWTSIGTRPGTIVDPLADLLPSEGETWHVGGKRTIGAGRVSWHPLSPEAT